MNRNLQRRIEKAENNVPTPRPRREHHAIVAQWFGLPDGADGFDLLLCELDGEKLTELQEALNASNQRGFSDFQRHHDATWMQALRDAFDLVCSRSATARPRGMEG